MPAVLPRLVVCACVMALAACSGSNPPNSSNPSNPTNPNSAENRPSPIPAGYGMLLAQQQRGGVANRYTEGGDTVDELLAVVDGEYLTRQEVRRRLKLPTSSGRPDASEQEEMNVERLRWAQQRLVLAAARRAGMRLGEAQMDEYALSELKALIKRHEEETEEKLTPDEYLASIDLSWAEFREEKKDDITQKIYFQKLMHGIYGTRSEVDMDLSPAEVRRIYFDNRKRFDLKAGVRFAFFLVHIKPFETPERDFLESAGMARKRAEEIRDDFRRGMTPEEIRLKYEMDEVDVRVSPKGAFADRLPQPEATAWAFHEERKPGDAMVIDDLETSVTVGLIETRPARQRTMDEVRDEIRRIVSYGKVQRMVADLTIQQLNRGSVVWPDELADELLDEAHIMLDQLATDPVLSKVRLR